jgi:site-specific DNA recombinase
MERAAVYVRVSSDKQREKHTITSQLEAIKEYASKNGYEVVEGLIFTDDGYSGGVLERPGLERMRELALVKAYKTLLVLCPDRLARNYVHQVLLLEELECLGVNIIFIQDEIRGKGSDVELLTKVKGIISEYECIKIMERCIRGKMHNAKAGYVSVLGRAPYGYKYYACSGNSKAVIEIDEGEAEIVRYMFEMLVEGRMSSRSIAKRLMEEGIKSPKGLSHWQSGGVLSILRNSAYVGKAYYNKSRCRIRTRRSRNNESRRYFKGNKTGREKRDKSEWIEIPIPAIISEELYNQGQEQIMMNAKRCIRNNKRNEYLLRGLLVCGECGYALTGTFSRGHKYYHCTHDDAILTPHCKKRCKMGSVRAEDIEDVVWEAISGLLKEPEQIISAYQNYVKEEEEKNKVKVSKRAEQEKELAKAKRKRDNLVDMCQADIIPLEELKKRVKVIDNHIASLEQSLKLDVSYSDEVVQEAIETLESFKEQIHSSLEDLEIKEKREILELLIDQIIVKNDKIVIKHLIPVKKKFDLRQKRSNIRCSRFATHNFCQ